MDLQLKSYVSMNDVKELAKVQFGPDTEVTKYLVTRACHQGFTSLILRVEANVININERAELTHSWIAKVEPEVPEQLSKVRDDELLIREGLFFKVAVPLLKKRCQKLPVVECMVATPKCLYLEDLTEYQLIKNLEYSHVKLIIEKLAILHASSLDIDWLNELPHVKKDCILQSKGQAFRITLEKSCSAYSKFIEKYHPNLEKNILLWLNNTKPFELICHYLKYDSKNLNVLTHGDFWTNNILFKFNNDELEDLKFIDFPANRLVPPSRDIQYLLYTCTSGNFRKENEYELLNIYVQSFNSVLGNERLLLDEFVQEYESSSLYGSCMALVFRTLSLMNEISYCENEIMNREKFAALSMGWDSMLQRCDFDFTFKTQVQEILDDLLKKLK